MLLYFKLNAHISTFLVRFFPFGEILYYSKDSVITVFSWFLCYMLTRHDLNFFFFFKLTGIIENLWTMREGRMWMNCYDLATVKCKLYHNDFFLHSHPATRWCVTNKAEEVKCQKMKIVMETLKYENVSGHQPLPFEFECVTRNDVWVCNHLWYSYSSGNKPSENMLFPNTGNRLDRPN